MLACGTLADMPGIASTLAPPNTLTTNRLGDAPTFSISPTRRSMACAPRARAPMGGGRSRALREHAAHGLAKRVGMERLDEPAGRPRGAAALPHGHGGLGREDQDRQVPEARVGADGLHERQAVHLG